MPYRVPKEVPAVGTYRVSWIATWNAGTLPAIDVSEIGLSLCSDDSDGDFTTFTVNVAVPLTIEWRLTFTFA